MIKLQICEQDPYDRGQRRILNFGHTIAHAIEALEDFSLPHGEAVAFGMIIEARLSVQKQLLDHDSLCKIFDLIHGYGFALDRYKSVDVDMLYGRACQDKKNSGGLVHFVALKEIAEVSVSNGAFVHAMSRSELGLAIDWHRAMLEKSHDLSCC